MAKVKIQGHASGTGILTVTAPNTSTDRTITLPDATGTLLTEVADNAITLAKMASGTDGNIISYDASGNPVAIATGNDGQVLTSTGAGSPPAFEAAAAGGKVLQVLWHQNTSQDNTFATSWVDTNTIAITPASGSTLLFIHTLNVALSHTSGLALRIFRDGTTDIGSQPSGADADSASHFARTGGASGTQVHTSHAATWFYVHNGNGSTSMSFKTQRRMAASSNTSYFQYYNSPSSLTIIEIGA